MINGMYLSTMGAMIQTTRHATIANNLANVNTAGFKPDTISFRSLPAESAFIGSHRPEVHEILERTGGGAWVNRITGDFMQGALKATGNPLNMALTDSNESSTSFFAVQSGTNDVLYTRDGTFMRDQEGYLVTTNGRRVLGASGGPVQLPDGSQPRVQGDGSIIDEVTGEPIGQVGVWATETPEGMTREGENFFARQNVTMTPAQRHVQGGAVEGSATSSITEMVNMIEGHRTYEANMTFLRMQDESLGMTVQRLGTIA